MILICTRIIIISSRYLYWNVMVLSNILWSGTQNGLFGPMCRKASLTHSLTCSLTHSQFEFDSWSFYYVLHAVLCIISEPNIFNLNRTPPKLYHIKKTNLRSVQHFYTNNISHRTRSVLRLLMELLVCVTCSFVYFLNPDFLHNNVEKRTE